MKATMKVLLRSVLIIAATVFLVWPLTAAFGNGSHDVSREAYNNYSYSTGSCKELRIKVWNGDNTTCSGAGHKIVSLPNNDWTTSMM